MSLKDFFDWTDRVIEDVKTEPNCEGHAEQLGSMITAFKKAVKEDEAPVGFETLVKAFKATCTHAVKNEHISRFESYRAYLVAK